MFINIKGELFTQHELFRTGKIPHKIHTWPALHFCCTCSKNSKLSTWSRRVNKQHCMIHQPNGMHCVVTILTMSVGIHLDHSFYHACCWIYSRNKWCFWAKNGQTISYFLKIRQHHHKMKHKDRVCCIYKDGWLMNVSDKTGFCMRFCGRMSTTWPPCATRQPVIFNSFLWGNQWFLWDKSMVVHTDNVDVHWACPGAVLVGSDKRIMA